MPILYNPNPSVAYWLTLAVTLLLPILVGLVTKASWSSGLKAVLLLAFSAATAIISNLLAVDGVTDVGPMVTAVISTFVIAVASHFGFWKPTEVSAKAQNVLVKDDVAPAA
jgi:uncharacterized membrane protein YhiD involved in acid resistance